MGVMRILMGLSLIICIAAAAGADDTSKEASPEEPRQAPSIEGILKKGIATQSLPEGVVVRVRADMFRVEPPKSRMKECWEFSTNQVHRVVVDWSKKPAFRRVQSLPFDTKDLCKDLANGNLLVIEAQEGVGRAKLFAGTDFQLGDRGIEVLHEGQSLIEVGESCVFAGMAETDAIAFAALYEQLASQARAAFQ